MQRSASRILRTHTGSLPRPRDLTRLYALQARGAAVSRPKDKLTNRQCRLSRAMQLTRDIARMAEIL
jgi:hypothetical protein